MDLGRKKQIVKKLKEIFNEEEPKDIEILQKGMTNRSYLFCLGQTKYIIRIPGDGTDKLIDRHNESDNYEAIKDTGLCDNPYYINAENGIKVTRYLEDARCCDARNETDIVKCMGILKRFHDMNLRVDHVFDIFDKIDYYESLWDGKESKYKDYAKIKAHVLLLRTYVENKREAWCLSHIDAIPDNFLFHTVDGVEHIQLMDWEYAGMQDPHVDIAMFCIYSLYDKKECDHLIDIYFNERCKQDVRTKIYCYIAMCGLLWSNWCEYKRSLGIDFGEYADRQYQYAKEYFDYATEAMKGGM